MATNNHNRIGRPSLVAVAGLLFLLSLLVYTGPVAVDKLIPASRLSTEMQASFLTRELNAQLLKPAPDGFDQPFRYLKGAFDVNIITGETPSNYPHVTQNESFIWSEGNTIVIAYNDSSGVPHNVLGLSYSTDAGTTFTRILPSPFATGHGDTPGDPIVAYNRQLGRWFAGGLAHACGGKGIGLWASTNGVDWSPAECAHSGTADDRPSMWADNNPSSQWYGYMYVSLEVGNTLAVVYSNDGTQWTLTPIPYPSSLKNMQLTGDIDGGVGTVYLAAMDEQGATTPGSRTHIMFKSTDHGMTWSTPPNPMVASAPAPGQEICRPPRATPVVGIKPIWAYTGWGQPAVGTGGDVHYVYGARGTRLGDVADIYYVRSTDHGESWSTPIRINDDAGVREQWMPSLSATTSGAVTLGWYDRRDNHFANNEQYKYRAKISTDNGVTWSSDVTVSDVDIMQPRQPDSSLNNSCFAGDYNYHFASSDTAYLAWTDGRNSISYQGTPIPQQDVYFDKISLPCNNYTLAVTTGSGSASNFVPGSSCNNCAFSISLPFVYQLYDRTFTSVNASTNGTLQFVGSNTSGSNVCLQDSPLKYSLMPYWDQIYMIGRNPCLSMGDCGIWTEVSGIEPNRVFTIQWNGVVEHGNPLEVVDFVVQLFEGQTRCDFIYNVPGAGSGESATIGLLKDSTCFTQFSCPPTASLTNGLRLVFTLPPPPTRTPMPTLIPTNTPGEVPFQDVNPSDYFYTSVRHLFALGAISGYSDGTFRPFANTTRGQLAKIIVLSKAWTINTDGGPHFIDVPSDNPFYPYVETAYNNEVISGYSDGTFQWGNYVTRGQLCKVVVQAQGWAVDKQGGPHFIDVPVGHPFYGFVETAYNRGIISGYGCNANCLEFRPANSATRGQISKIVYAAVTQP